jgi:hypothetical protein
LAVVGHIDSEALIAQTAGDKLGHFPFVFDNQDSHIVTV